MKEKQCPFCGDMILYSLQKCPSCQEYLDVTCPYCGATVSAFATYCNRCSHQLTPQKEYEEHIPWAIASAILSIFICVASIATIYSLFGNVECPLVNATITDKVTNCLTSLFLLIFPSATTVIACKKKQGVPVAILSLLIAFVATLSTIILLIVGN